MPNFDLIASTTRGGVTIDQVEFPVESAPVATGYLLGRRNDGPQPIVIALHHERGDKATLLPDLEHLAARGFLCLGIDSPITRSASAERNPLSAFDSQFAIALAAMNLLQADPNVQPHRTALIGRGLGGEVGAKLATHTRRAQVVVAMDVLPDRSSFVQRSDHPLAAGIRLFNDEAELARQVAGLGTRKLIAQLEQDSSAQWLLQIADDDDRLGDDDRSMLSVGIPRTVRVERVALGRDLWARQARRARVDFVSNLCG